MAAKNAKAKPGRTTLKAKAKARAKASRTVPRAKAKATPKPKAKPTKKRVQTTAPSPPPPVLVPAEEAPAADTAALETKRGPLARFAGGVGNLLARMTGKKTTEADQTPPRSPDQTIELASGDILAVTEAPPPTPKPKS